MALLTGCQARLKLLRDSLQGAQKLLKQGPGVVWAGRCLRVVLHSEDREVAVSQAFDRAIIQVYVGHFEVRRARDAVLVAQVVGGSNPLAPTIKINKL